MKHRISNSVKIGGDNSGPITQTGIDHGGHPGPTLDELAKLLDELRHEVRGQGLPRQEVLNDVLDDLTEDVGKHEIEPAVVRSRWQKAQGILAGFAQWTELVAKISDHVQRLFT